MRVFYISNFPLDGTLSPSINEIGFAESLYKNLPEQSFFFIKGSCNEVELPTDKLSFFKDIPLSKPCSFLFHSILWALRVCNLAKKHKSDIIIIRCARAPLKELLLTYITSKKVILKSSSKYWIDPPDIHLLAKILRKIDLFLYKLLHKRVDGIECVTQEYKDLHIKNGISTKKLYVVGNAVSTKNFFYSKNNIKKDHFPILGYCGANPSERGVVQILYLVEQLKPLYPKIKGMIIGNDQELKIFKKQAKDLGLQDNMDWIGQVSFKDVPKYLKYFDIGFSFTAPRDIVGGDSAMKVRQYLAMGIPVITFSMSNKFIADNKFGYLVESDDLKNLTPAVIKLIDNIKTKGTSWKKEISTWAHKNFSYDVLLQQRLAFWQKIFNGK